MTKTLHGNALGELFVGSNNVFDFSHMIGIIRSFSYGVNLPFMSPFQAGLPYVYHFFFALHVSLWEYFGVPMVYAINIPSIMSFALLLIVIYYLPQLLFKQSAVVGWIAVFFTITNPTLTWWNYFLEKGISIHTLQSLWILPTYPYRGPFDGSTISIFMTLNNFINQRHLAFAIASSLFFIILLFYKVRDHALSWKHAMLCGIFIGGLSLWNISITGVAVFGMALYLYLKSGWKKSVVFVLSVLVCVSIGYGQFVLSGIELFTLGTSAVSAPFIHTSFWYMVDYFWQNFSVLPLLVIGGFWVTQRRYSTVGFPFLILTLVMFGVSIIGNRVPDQKFLSFLIIWLNVFASIFIWHLWTRRAWVVKVFAYTGFLMVTISGIIDFMPIKNEFAYPLIDRSMLPVISWIRMHTPHNAVFVSYQDMIDPVAFAGRKNYFGFFGNIGSMDRSQTVRNIYAGDIQTARSLNISYVLVPKEKKTDFPYTVDTMFFKKQYEIGYEDERFLIFRLQ
jgi:hypothetical protein